MVSLLTSLRNWSATLVAGLIVCGCVAVKPEVQRHDTLARLPRDARIGLTDFTRCGAGYLDRLNGDSFGQDRRAQFLRTCTEFGYPGMFHEGLRQRLEKRLGKKLVRVKSDRPFMAKSVLRDGEQLNLDYVLAGDLLAMGETPNEAVVATQLFVVRVSDRKVVLKEMVRKNGSRGKLQEVVDAVADELYDSSFTD